MDRPIVLCGLGRMGSRVLDYLLAAKLPVVVLDTVCQPEDARLRGARLIRGDCRSREVLEAAGVADARGVLILTSDDLLNISTALMVRSLNKEVRIVLRMFNQNLMTRLGKAVHNVFALSTSLLTAPVVAMAALTGQSLGTYRLNEKGQGVRQLVEISIGPHSPWRDQPINSLCRQRGVVVVARFAAEGEEQFLMQVSGETILKVGDHLVVHGSPQDLEPLLATDQSKDHSLRFAHGLKRLGRMIGRTLAEMDLAVLIGILVVVVIVVVSTLVLHFGVTKYTIPDALLRSVSIMATAASMHEEDYEDAPGIRVFVSILRIVGAVVMAAFTAIVTNYLLRAKLGGALEVRRIPESGHVVVCGLGAVGFRIVEELIRLKQPVVVLDRDPSSRFITTARRLGAAVMIGDASVVEVLRQTNSATARAVVAATSNDMTNLEVALLVRELNAEQRIVLLLNDPQFAQMLREAAGVRLAVSVPALAAPAFLAGLFGDRVASVFFLRERLFAVLALVVHEDDLLVGLPLRAVAIDYRFLPVELIRPEGEVPHPILGGRLQVGDRLLGIVALSDLERLLRRQPSSAQFAVEVTEYPRPARGWLVGLVRMHQGCSGEEAEQRVEQLPLRLACNLTRGQAEDLLAQLHRERVKAHLENNEEGVKLRSSSDR